MPTKIFLAGAGGAIGKRLVPLLRRAGHVVYGTTRSASKVDALRAAGVIPVVVDVFDSQSLLRSVMSASPEIVIHQLTDLPANLEPSLMAEAVPRNARIRSEGTQNLVAAARAAGARRFIAQSIAWAYAEGPQPHREDDPLDLAAEAARAVTVRGVETLERLTVSSEPLEGIVLRYGQLYGPNTGSDNARGSMPVHVDAAAYAALLAIDRGRPGAYNIAEESAYISADKARAELGWDATFRLPSDAQQPTNTITR